MRLMKPMTSNEVVFSIYGGHETSSAITPKTAFNSSLIAQATIERLLCAAKVIRNQVRKGRLQEMFYVPLCDRPLLGVLDLTSIPLRRIFEQRACLLASHGLIVFAADCLDYDGLPDENHLELEYFLKCAE